MISENLPPTGRTFYLESVAHLKTIGLGIEYFPGFFQEHTEFHTHEFVEFLFVLKGTIQHVTGDHSYDESAGRVAIINYNQFHGFKTSTGIADLMNIYWNPGKYPMPELPEPLSTQLNKLIPAHPMLGHRLNRIVRLQLKNPEETNRLLQMLLREQNKEDPGSKAAIDALFRLLLIKICRAASIVPEEDVEEFNPRMEKIRLYLEKNFTESIRLEHLCELTGLKESNLCRQFKKYTGLSIGNYLKQRRLATAMQQLRTTNNKILEICYNCGFPDITHFNHTFRMAIGETPSDYRKRFDPAKDHKI
ncbi:MAG: hypothetical protein DRP64_05580 [Verrucomicrobia bacterium]|nr:MAG: hypothetical protein DRP64_05580 [Verrucomicrobiota bacterium]